MKRLNVKVFSSFAGIKKILNKKGYITITALITTLLVMAFGSGVLLMGYYTHANTLSRKAQKQVHQYALGVIESTEQNIEKGLVNITLAQVAEKCNNDTSINASDMKDNYWQRYSFVADLGSVLGGGASDDLLLKNPENNDYISVELNITYIPKKEVVAGKVQEIKLPSLPGRAYDLVQRGDRLEIEYRVTIESGRSDTVSYLVTGVYECYRDDSLAEDGTSIVGKDKTIESMRWKNEKYYGNQFVTNKK